MSHPNSMRVLITGSTGFIGRFLVPQLIQKPETATSAGSVTVTLLLRETYSGRPLPAPLNQLRPQFNIVYADLRNFNLTVRAVREAKPDAVIHLAAAGATDPFLGVETAVRHNLTGTINLLRACFEKTFGVQQFIVARTPGELLGINTYAASKAAAWEFCRMYARTREWPIYGGMIFQAYGPGQPERTFIPAAFRAALAGEDFPMTAGTQARDWIFAEDVAAGFSAMLGQPLAPATTIDIGTGTATSLIDVATLIYQTVNRGGRPLPGTLPSRPGEDPTQTADAANTQELIGWQAGISLVEGIKKLKLYQIK
ncbi:MAG: NAD(P)-dependent oxidoreductase [Anaerolineae bacterium]|nr:NAD(P)-dependent oxidoreductase [Anaerolineae bacterium]